MPDTLLESIDASREFVVELQKNLVSIPALGPDNGGDGEREKADYLLERLREFGVPDIRELNAPDDRVSCGHRPNILARFPGRDDSRTLWIISHMDVVPAGDPDRWDGDPFTLAVDGDTLIGRGVEDNHQGIAASMVLARSLAETGVRPPINLGLALVSDEETGSEYGLEYLAEEHPDLFRPDDLVVIPDYGVSDSSLIEVAEKSMLWLKMRVDGKQCHASTPGRGINSLTAAAELIIALRGLYDEFGETDPLFDPSFSTFEATKKEANVPNVNTIPGADVFYVDCRVLPQYDLEDVILAARRIARKTEERLGVRVSVSVPMRAPAAQATPRDSEVVVRLVRAVNEIYGVEAAPGGIGGGTVAAVLRKREIPCAVWSTSMHYAHQPNERATVSGQIGDAKVLARVLFGE
jgi:succinyl-diaminopimelate desuccinylase